MERVNPDYMYYVKETNISVDVNPLKPAQTKTTRNSWIRGSILQIKKIMYVTYIYECK